MFAESQILRKLDAHEKAFGWRPIPHTVSDCDRMVRHFNDEDELIVKSRTGNIDLRRPLTKPEKQWIANERALCNTPEAPIWMADCTFKPIGEVRPGDEIIGWKRETRPTAKRYRNAKPMNLERLCKSKVIAVARRKSPIVKLTMESGRVIRCTPDHLWSCGATYRNQNPWQTPKVGRTLRRVVDVYPNNPADLAAAAWLGGFYDGEGHAESFSQNRQNNPEVCARLEGSLERLGFKYGVYRTDNDGRTGRDRRADMYYIQGGRDEYARFLAQCKPSKRWSLEKKIFRSIAAAPDRIVKMEDDGEGEVVSMQTETGNYIVWGYASKNCAYDCAYFLTRYYWIQSEASHAGGSNIMHFEFRSGQRVFYRVLQRLDAQQKAKKIFCLKARKQGISTLVEGLMTWGALFFPGTRVAIASADGQKSQIMAGMFYFAVDELPWWLESTRTRDKRASDRGIVEWSHIGNQVILQSGSMKGGIGQGTTPNFCHISEASQFTNAVQQLDEGLFKAVTNNPNNVLIVETTGDGDEWTAKLWNESKDNYWIGKAPLLPLFLPWFMTPELYPSQSWINQYPIPRDWSPAPETLAMTIKCEAYVATTPTLLEELGKGWKLPREQQWWWEFEYMSHKRRGIEKSFTRQHPCDDLEALIGENDKAVGEEALEQMKKSVNNEAQVYMIAGEGIESKNEPDRAQVLSSQDAVHLYTEWENHKGDRYDWGFIPMESTLAHMQDSASMTKALIWEEPQEGYDYGIGVDTGTGIEQDRSTIIVTKKGLDDDEPDVQVAEFADDTIGNTELWAWVAAVTSLYARHMKTDSTKKHPKLCIELRRKFGDMTFNQLYHGLNFRRHNWFVPLDKTTFRPIQGKQGRPGFWTLAWSRPLLLGFFTASLENGWYQVRSKFLQNEIKNSEMRVMKSGATKMDHVSGEHNDRIFGAALSHWTLHDAEVLAEFSKRKYNSGNNKPLEIDFAPYTVQVNVGGYELWKY